MKDIAPQVTRQRLLIEARYQISITRDTVTNYLKQVAEVLGLRIYGKPTIHSPSGQGKMENQGYDAFVPLIDSGISLYVWTNERFISCIIYSCKKFSADKAVEFTQNFWQTTELEHTEF